MSRVSFDISMSLDGFITADTSGRTNRWARAVNDSTIGRSPATTTATVRSSPAGWRVQGR
jgi:hypothetical protein